MVMATAATATMMTMTMVMMLMVKVVVVMQLVMMMTKLVPRPVLALRVCLHVESLAVCVCFELNLPVQVLAQGMEASLQLSHVCMVLICLISLRALRQLGKDFVAACRQVLLQSQ